MFNERSIETMSPAERDRLIEKMRAEVDAGERLSKEWGMSVNGQDRKRRAQDAIDKINQFEGAFDRTALPDTTDNERIIEW